VSDTAGNKFKDAAGREWRLSFALGDLPRLRDVGFDLTELLKSDSGFIEFLYGDPERFGRVLWTLVEAQAQAAAVAPEDFARSIDLDALNDAAQALMGYVVDFRQRLPGARAAAKAALPEALRKIDEAAARKIESQLKSPPTGPSSPTAGGSPGTSG
jgi:hypothetical protein